ncbi:putative peptidase S28 [Rosa chinensis]|uniref:Putative peptidase S28 n=1 Tax=Rosa chinensis TaxID=74649 RepID=A0A2P6QGJ7_ROSCH|nr:putative peptidase S28 [Rosa chinensis]
MTHANNSFSTFQQNYVINSKYWGGSKINVSAPIFAYLGAESSLDSIIPYIGFLPENARQFRALLIYIEEASETCYQTIRKSWSEIDEIASKPGGLSILSNIFHTRRCFASMFFMFDFTIKQGSSIF